MRLPASPPLSFPRVGPFDRAAAAAALPYAAIVALGTIAFAPGLGAGFVSDDFNIVYWARSASLGDALGLFLPSSTHVAGGALGPFYRPATNVLFWAEYQLFGDQPAAYHMVALVLHLAIAVLLYRLARRLGVRVEAALAGVVAFVLTIHAHELVFWWAAGHYAFGGLAIVAAVLAYAAGRPLLSLPFVALALLSDEAGVALLPVLAAYEVLLGRPAAGAWAAALGRRLLRLAPAAAAVAAYLALRLANGGLTTESDACRTPDCDALGVVEYFDRLFVRPGRLIELLRQYTTANRLVMAAVIVAVLVAAAVALRAWRWRRWRVTAFGLAWLGIFTAVLVYGLWPYVSDRFLYYPEMGFALALAAILQEATRGWLGARRPAQAATAAFLAGYVAWLGIGVLTIWHRAGQWNDAGRTVAAIFDATVRLEPHPPRGAVLVFSDVPDSLPPDIPPGNTGPYLLRNGLTTGLRLRYGRTDISPIPATQAPPQRAASVACFEIVDANVVPTGCPRT